MGHLIPGRFSSLLTAVLCTVLVEGQVTVQYQQFTSDNGLSENVVYSLLKDKKGYIWVGTDYGLNRYDGYSFKKYLKIPGDSSSFSDFSVLSLLEDRNGIFWIGSYRGLNSFDPRSGQVERISLNNQKQNMVINHVELLSGNNIIVFPDNISCYRYDPVLKKSKRISLPVQYGLSGNKPFRLTDNRLALFGVNRETNETDILVFNEANDEWSIERKEKLIPGITLRAPTNFFTDTSGICIVFSLMEQSLRVYDSIGNEIALFSPEILAFNERLVLYDISAFSPGIYWIATNWGLLVYDREQGIIRPAELKGDSRSLPGNKEIRCLLNDGKGSIWMGIFGEGLLRSDSRKPVFSSIPLPELSGGEFLRMIFGLYRWSDDIIAAETGFKNLILIKDGKVIRRVKTAGLSPEEIAEITTGRKLTELNPFHQRVIREEWQKGNLAPFFFKLPDDSTLVSYYPSVTIYRPGHVKSYSVENPGNLVDAGDFYWVSGTNGLFRIQKSSLDSSLIRFNTSIDEPETYVYHIAKDENGNIWMGTKGAGLSQFDSRHNKFLRYTTEDGLPDNTVYFVLNDGIGNLWLTTNNGISRFNIVTKAFTNYSKRDGLLNSEFNRQGGLRMKDGTLYFSGTSGIDYFNPADLPQTVRPPVVQFTEIRVNNREVVITPDTSLRFSQNNLTIAYSANDFIRPDLIYYRYRLGSGETWTRVQGMNRILYNALPAGHYHFEVQSSYDNLNWSESAIYSFAIRRPWWRTTWFYLTLSFLIGTFLYGVYHYRVSQLKKMHQLRSKISRDLHDDIGATLTSISFLSEVARKQTEGMDKPVSETLEKIGSYSRDMIGEINDIVWAINPSNDTFGRITDRMKNFALPLLSARNIRLEFSAGDELVRFSPGMEQRKNLFLIFKEAISNAVKYADCSVIDVTFLKERNSLTLLVADNGKGFNVQEHSDGNGLKNMELRAKEIRAKIEIISSPGKGTLVKLVMPITQNADAG